MIDHKNKKMLAFLASWEALLVGLTLLVLFYAVVFVPNFVSTFNLSQAAAGMAEKALLVLPMALLVIAREIDLSVASTMALSSVILGVLIQLSMPLSVAIPLVLVCGAIAGGINGLLVTQLELPSLLVTLGTMALFRGIGYIILGSASVNVLPEALANFGLEQAFGTIVPWTIVPFLLLAPLFGLILHKALTGRHIYALGGSPLASIYSGIAVNRLRLQLFVASGVISALAGVVITARLSNARADNALGFELDVITIVFLGGVSVFGGRGKLTGVVCALVLVSVIRNVLGLNQISGAAQGVVIGALLIGSLLLSNAIEGLMEHLRLARGAKKIIDAE